MKVSKGKILGIVFISTVGGLIIMLSVVFLSTKSLLPLANAITSKTFGLRVDAQAIDLDVSPLRLRAEELSLVRIHKQTDKSSSSAKSPLFEADDLTLTLDIKGYLDKDASWWSVDISDAAVYAPGSLSLNDTSATDQNDTAEKKYEENNRKDDTVQNSGTSELIRGAFSFNSVTVHNLMFNRQQGEKTLRFSINDLTLLKDSDERIKVDLDGQYKYKPVTAGGVVVLPRSDRAQNIDFNANILGNRLRINGTVGHDGIIPGEASFEVNLSDLSELSQLADVDLSSFAPLSADGTLQAPELGQWMISVTGNLRDKDFSAEVSSLVDAGKYSIERAQLVFGQSELSGTGNINFSEKSFEADVGSSLLAVSEIISSFNSETKNRSKSQRQPDLRWLAAWQVDAKIKIDALSYSNFVVKDLDLNAEDVEQRIVLGAGMENVIRFANNGEAQRFASSIDNGSKQRRTAGETPVWSIESSVDIDADISLVDTLPRNGLPLKLSVELGGSAATFDGLLPLALSSGYEKSDKRPLNIDGEFTLDVESFEPLSGFDKKRWDAFLPLSLNLRATTEQSKTIFNQFRLELAGDVLEGALTFDQARAKPYISGNLQGSKVDINRFGMTTAKVIEDKGSAIDTDSGDVIGDEKINWAWLDELEADLELGIDTLVFNQTNFFDVKTRVALKQGELKANPIDAGLKDGVVEGDLKIAKTSESALLSFRFYINDLSPADLGLKNEGLIDGGRTNLSMDLRSLGSTPQEIASQLDGEIILEVRKARIRNGLFELIGSDLLTQTVNLINPFAETRDTTDLECAAAHISAREGVLESQGEIIIETENMKIRGKALVDLNDETLRIDFAPSPRKGIGLSLSKLSSAVRIDGTLGKPKVVADPDGILSVGARIGAAVASGGLTWIAEGLFERFVSSGTDCGEIFKKTTGVSATKKAES